MAKRILLIGNATMDMVLRVEKLPRAGETAVSGASYGFLPGGRGTQLATAMGRLSGGISFSTRLGADSHGKRLLSLFEEIGIDTRFIGIDKLQNTGFSAVLGEDNGDVRVISYPGANQNISRGDIEDAFESDPALVFLQTELPVSLVFHAAEEAARRHTPIFLELTEMLSQQDLERFPQLECLILNEETTESLTGLRPGGIDNSLRAGIELARRVKARYYVMKLGNRGAFVYDGRFCHLIPAYQLRKVVDTAGVGDAFSGALAVFYAETGDMTQAAKFACAAAAASLMRAGTVTSYPTKSEVEVFISQNPTP